MPPGLAGSAVLGDSAVELAAPTDTPATQPTRHAHMQAYACDQQVLCNTHAMQLCWAAVRSD
jgi:hypothetical protein